jgi:hypothetical protein
MQDAEIETLGPLAEFNALRAEILARQGAASSILLYQLTSAAGVISFALSDPDRTPLLLVIPFTSYLLAWRYTMHSLATHGLGRYIKEELHPRVPGGLGWESWLANQAPGISRRFFISPNRLIFTGVALPATIWVGIYLATSVGSTIDWPRGLGLSALWLAGAAVAIESWTATQTGQAKWSSRSQRP